MAIRKKRVVLDVDSLVPYYAAHQLTGIGRTTMELVCALEQLGELPVEILLYSQNMKGIGARNMQSSFPKRHLYLPFRNGWNQALSHTPLRRWLTGYDLYHIPHNFDFVSHPEKTIVTLHDALFYTCPDEAFNYAFARKHYPQLAQQCRGIITCSQASKGDIMHYMQVPEEKIAVIPWGVNHDTFHPTEIDLAKEDKSFLCVSCSKGRKNTLAVVQAYVKFYKQLAPDQQEQAHSLTLVWRNPCKEVNEIVRQEHLRHKINIVAGLSDAQLAQYYRQATCTFFPSRREGFGLPVLESMACGTPVVTCHNSSLPEVGGDAALYTDPDDIDFMAGIMTRFENGTLQKAALRQRCVAQASKFTWQRCAEQTVQFYCQCLGL